jgi:hypothetical protein
VQFATSMAMMARSLGIPARLGVGFLPGTSQGDGTYTVTARQAHAWPELYFEGSGWVRFEPTPAVQTGAPPRWSDPYADLVTGAGPDTEAIAPTAAAPGASPATTPRATTPSAPQVEEHDVPWAAVAVTVAVVMLVAAGAGLLARRRTARRAELVPERAWRHLRDHLAGRGLGWSEATTPRAAVAGLQDALEERTGSRLEGTAERALVSLARAVEDERYAPTWEQVDGDRLERWVAEASAGVAELLSDRTRRADAPSAPRSAP